MDDSEGPYPEHAKLGLVQPFSQAIGEFLDWAAETHGLHLCRFDRRVEMWFMESTPKTRLLAERYGIDLAVIEDEKRAMLASIREQAAEVAAEQALAEGAGAPDQPPTSPSST